MSQIKLLGGSGSLKQLMKFTDGSKKRLIFQQTRTLSTDSAEPTAKPAGWYDAKPLSECPSASIWEFITGYMPGGKFYKKDVTHMIKVMYQEKGDILIMPGGFGKPDMVMTQNPDDIATVYRNDGVWPQRPGFELMTHFRKVYRKDVFEGIGDLTTTQGKEWGDFRKAVNPILIHPKNIKVYLPSMSEVNAEFIEKIKTIRDPETLEVPENFVSEINRWTLESVGVVALDTRLNLIKDNSGIGQRYFEILERFFHLSVDLEIKPSLWRLLPTPKFKEVMGLIDEMLEFTDKLTNSALEKIQNRTEEKPDAEKSVLEKLLKIDKKIATITAMDMLLAAVDTTTSTFTGLMLCLAKNPEKQQKLREEIMRILPEKDSPLTEENMKNLPYLRACLKESLRLYPVTSGNVRRTQVDLVLSGYRVNKGTDIALLNINLLRDPNNFSQPDEFIPERWLRQDPTEMENCPHSEKATKNSHPFVYLPFGFGVRSCIGRRIAEMEVEIGVARILRNFHVEFNHSVENAFVATILNIPNIPLKFKFVDLKE